MGGDEEDGGGESDGGCGFEVVAAAAEGLCEERADEEGMSRKHYREVGLDPTLLDARIR